MTISTYTPNLQTNLSKEQAVCQQLRDVARVRLWRGCWEYYWVGSERIHFYLGSVGAGLICIVACCVGVGWLLGLVEGILLLAMSDEEFDAKYNERTPESLEFVFQKIGPKV